MWEENFGTQAGVHLIEGVRLIWGPLNTGSTVFRSRNFFTVAIILSKNCFSECLSMEQKFQASFKTK